MKKFLFLLLAVTAGTAPAQTLVYPGEHEMPPVPKTFDNELGVRYGAQLYVGEAGTRIAGLFDRLCPL